ncbi:MAG: ATP-binding protein [bacterium]
MKREISEKLTKWRDKNGRKVLLVRGARQVGKTYSIREFGKNFDGFLEVNFEEHPEVKSFFSASLNPSHILEKLSLYFNYQIKAGETLLFFDEIQACPDAIRSLRFFYEKMPQLHLIAAGSLLEFALAEIPSFGVGRIDTLFMFPMNFFEFLEAIGAELLIDLIKNASPGNPVDPTLHLKTMDIVKTFQLIGGLPEVVKKYVETKNLLECQEIIDSLILNYIDDFAKYRKKTAPEKLQEVFKSLSLQAGAKFKYSNISSERSSSYKTALDLLLRAGLAYKVFHTSARGIPLGAQIKDNKFKVVIFDVGIYQRMQGLDLSEYVISDYTKLINKGALAELFVYNELISSGTSSIKPEIYYWHREKRGSNAEVDYIVAINGKILPIEVKSGTKGQMQSMFLFLSERKLSTGIRLSGENFSKYEKVLAMPIYAARNIWSLKLKTSQ